MMFTRSGSYAAVLLACAGVARCAPPLNNPPGVDVWCGKAYRETNSSFDPGGWLEGPKPGHSYGEPRLDLRIATRYNYFVKTSVEKEGSFVIDTPVSHDDAHGGVYDNSTYDPQISNDTAVPLTELLLTVWNSEITLVDNIRVPVNETGTLVAFDLNGLIGSTSFSVLASSPDGLQTWQSSAIVNVYAPRDDGGSMARLDHMTGGMYVSVPRLTAQGYAVTWKPIFPVSFYTRWDWISWLVDPENNPVPPNLASNNTKSLTAFRQRGYNLIHPVPPGGWESFESGILEKFLTICDQLGLYVMYDMRHTYLNLSSISYQLPRLQKHPSLLLYYTGDEPDGWTDPLNGTKLAFDRIREIDPYHPVSLVLNCYNFHFSEYTSGADIIMEDTYNLVKSSSFSTVYNTPCNRTYGDCGCDLCHYNDTAYPEFISQPFKDVSDRVDNFYQYQRWLDASYLKPVWGVPQYFYDADSFWSRWATDAEALVLALLRINHGAMGIVAWLFPTDPEIESATTELATILSMKTVTSLLVNLNGERLQPTSGDVTLEMVAWTSDDDMLIIIVWPYYDAGTGANVELPARVSNLTSLMGPVGWALHEEGSDSMSKEGTEPLEVSILMAKVCNSVNVC